MADRYAFGAITHGKTAPYFCRRPDDPCPCRHVGRGSGRLTNGAGDHFTAGLIYGRMHGLDLEHTGRLASYA